MQQSAFDRIKADPALAAVAHDLDRVARPALRLAAAPTDLAQLAPGATRFGGLPDVPASFVWPSWHDAPMAFLAQFDLAAVAQASAHTGLPATGALLFFYDAQAQTYGADPADRGGWLVFYAPGDPRQLARAAAPPGLAASAQLPACAVTWTPERSLPPPETAPVLGLRWPDATLARYEALLGEAETDAERRQPHHRLLGYPDQLQDELLTQAALVSHGITDPDAKGAAQVRAHARDWQLLLQLDSDEQAGMRWGSAGMLDFLIPQRALRASTFDATWCVLQSE